MSASSKIPISSSSLPAPRKSSTFHRRHKTMALSIESAELNNRQRPTIETSLSVTVQSYSMPSPRAPRLIAGSTSRSKQKTQHVTSGISNPPKEQKRSLPSSPAGKDKMASSSQLNMAMPVLKEMWNPTTPIGKAALNTPLALNTSQAPKKITTGSSTADSQEKTPPQSDGPYISAHMGSPCTIDVLDHELNCGHKVTTASPEPCASNCKLCHSKYANPRDVRQGFACLKCIVAKQQAKHEERVKTFKEELDAVAKSTKKPDPEAWIAGKIEAMAKAWKDISGAESMAEADKGRFCYWISTDPDEEGPLHALLEERLRGKGNL